MLPWTKLRVYGKHYSTLAVFGHIKVEFPAGKTRHTILFLQTDLRQGLQQLRAWVYGSLRDSMRQMFPLLVFLNKNICEFF